MSPRFMHLQLQSMRGIMLSSIKKGGGESVEKKRYHLIDALRGLALANMVAMHFLYDVNVVYGREPDWYLRPGCC